MGTTDADRQALLHRERTGLNDQLDGLDDHAWATPSLCPGWTVGDVAAHLAWAPHVRPHESLLGVARAGFRINRFVADSARAWRRRGRAAIMAQLRENARTGAVPPGVPPLAPLADAVVHGLDIRVPLGLAPAVPTDVFVPLADWQARARPPSTILIGGSARRRTRGLRLRCDEAGWSIGEGPVVTADTVDMLLMLMGRPVDDSAFSGPGAPALLARLRG